MKNPCEKKLKIILYAFVFLENCLPSFWKGELEKVNMVIAGLSETKM